jgi:triacylglycerol lipase
MSERKSYPVVLAHGIARPDYLIDSMFRTLNLSLYDFSFVSDRFHYFKGIATHLKKHRFKVYHSSVSFAADLETRASDLKSEVNKILEKSGKTKVHIIGHSMGGLDARHMIVHEKMADKVASLTTIGTPHLGTSVADVALEQGVDSIIGRFKVFLNLEGIRSVTISACREWNSKTEADEASNDVFYQTYSSSKDEKTVFLPFQISWKIVRDREGPNDGLVSVKSQRWKKKLTSGNHKRVSKTIKQNNFPINADHLDQIGWWNLNEIHKAGWWNLKALREKNKHEDIIKDVYLEIAEGVSDIH